MFLFYFIKSLFIYQIKHVNLPFVQYVYTLQTVQTIQSTLYIVIVDCIFRRT